MDISRATKALERTAQHYGITLEEVNREIENAIQEAMSSKTPGVRERWAQIPCEGEYPTPAELVAWIAEGEQI